MQFNIMYTTTREWLKSVLIIDKDSDCIIRNNRLWKSVAGFSQYGCIFSIYQDDYCYCVHSGDVWNENEEPNMGYYIKPITYNKLICEIAKTYDKIRK